MRSFAGKRIITVGCVLLTVILAGGVLFASERNPFEGDAGAIVAGAKIYLKSCAPCHGRMAQGGKAPDLTDEHWIYGDSDQEIFTSIFDGRASGYMPSMRGRLSEDETWKVVAFLRKIADR